MQGVFSKEREEIFVNPVIGSYSVPWWGGIGLNSPTNYFMEPFGQLKSSAHFPSFSANDKILTKADKTQIQTVNVMHGTIMDSRNYFELGFTQPLVCAKYPYEKQSCGAYSTYGPQLEGRIMLPLNLANNEGIIYVNPKQYHAIIRRRLSRAKSDLKDKLINRRKPFLHLSRHLHALRRPRGCGGRFLKKKNMDGFKKIDEGQVLYSQSPNSEVFQFDGNNINSPPKKSTNSNEMFTSSGSEVTSIFTRDLNIFPDDVHLGLWSPPQLVPDMTNTRHGSKWVPAADSCCNLNF